MQLPKLDSFGAFSKNYIPLFPRLLLLYSDIVSVIYLSTNPIQHQRTKHIDIDIHFVEDKVAIGDIYVQHVPSSLQYANIFTKGLPTYLFTNLWKSLSIRTSTTAQIVGVLVYICCVLYLLYLALKLSPYVPALQPNVSCIYPLSINEI